MTTFLTKFWNNQSGAAAAEYALILAIVGSGLAAAAVYLGTAISTSLKTNADSITAQAN